MTQSPTKTTKTTEFPAPAVTGTEVEPIPASEDGQFSLELFMGSSEDSANSATAEVPVRESSAAPSESRAVEESSPVASSKELDMADFMDAMPVFAARKNPPTPGLSLGSRQMQRALVIGDVVVASSVGAGTITSFTSAGAPRVSEVAAIWLECADGTVYDPKRRRP